MSQSFRFVNEDAVWVCVSDKETERTLCAAKVEWEVSGVVLLGAIVYYDTWRGGFPIMGEECYLTWLTTAWPKIFTFISLVPRCHCLSISNCEYRKIKWNLDNSSQYNRVLCIQMWLCRMLFHCSYFSTLRYPSCSKMCHSLFIQFKKSLFSIHMFYFALRAGAWGSLV